LVRPINSSQPVASGSDCNLVRRRGEWHFELIEPKIASDTDIPDTKDLMLNHAYKAMAWLCEAIEGEDSGQARHCTDAIEEALYQHRKSLFGAISVAFFDTKSLYFKGDGGATLSHPGHSKDFRPQLNQVALGRCWMSRIGRSLPSCGPATLLM
jgi:hypothetical protein